MDTPSSACYLPQMKIRPFIIGRGGAARAIEGALCMLRTANPDWDIAPTRRLAAMSHSQG